MQMEGMLPNIFAGNEEPILLIDEVEGMEFRAQIDCKGFSMENELVIKANVRNKNSLPKSYYAGTTSYGIRGVMGAALVSMDELSKFTDKFVLDTENNSSNAMVLEGVLEVGRELACDFNMLPFYKENRNTKQVTPGDYVLSLWYNESVDKVIKAEFPVKVINRFGKMYIKSY
jgi:hypothetical protein